MFEFLSTPEGVKLTAGVTIMIIAFAFLFSAHPFKKRYQLVVPVQESEPEMWTAGDYFTFLSSYVRSSPTLDELADTMPLIEGFFDKPYRVPISNFQLKKYYARLLEVYCNREKELVYVPLELHNN